MFVILAWFILELSILWLLEKAMATHSSILAWKILWMEEPGGLPSMGSHRVGHNWSDLAAAAVYYGCDYYASSVQSLNCVCLFVTPWTAACQASWSFTVSQSLLKLMSIESVMPWNHLFFRHSLLLPPSVFPSIRVFSKESVLRIRRPKYWSFSISPSNEHSGLISFRIDCLDLLEVQGTLKSLLQHHNSKVSILWRSAFFYANILTI